MWHIGSLCGKGDFCEELRKWMIDVCSLEVVRWREHSCKLLEMGGWRYMLWYSGKWDFVGGVNAMVKVEMSVQMVKVRMVSVGSYVVF